jgi:hypothetical protein
MCCRSTPRASDDGIGRKRRLLGLPLTGPLTPDQQDAEAQDLMTRTYYQRTGRNLLADLRNGDHAAEIAKALNPVWVSLPGGSQSNQSLQQFEDRLKTFANEEAHFGGVPTVQMPLYHQTPVAPVTTGAGASATPSAAAAPIKGEIAGKIQIQAPPGTRATFTTSGNAFKGPVQVGVMPTAGSIPPGAGGY